MKLRTFPLLITILAVFLTSTVGAQRLDVFVRETPPTDEEAAGEVAETVLTPNVALAVSSQSYPVTPGDTYSLQFSSAGDTIITQLIVQSDYSISFNVIGAVDASGMTYPELKSTIENQISSAYPRSNPILSIESAGVFEVQISGSVPQSSTVTAWGLSRLSDVLRNQLGRYSSIRDIRVRSEDGSLRSYDLFKALTMGELDENPRVRSGDVITISMARRVVNVEGEVYKPGMYQLRTGEDSRDLQDFFGGFTPEADTNRIVVRRPGTSEMTYLELTRSQYLRVYVPSNGDTIVVSAKPVPTAVVFLRGGLIPPPEEGVAEETIKVAREIQEGDTLYDVLKSAQPTIRGNADLANGYVISGSTGRRIYIDMEALLYGRDLSLDMTLDPLDTVVAPLVPQPEPEPEEAETVVAASAVPEPGPSTGAEGASDEPATEEEPEPSPPEPILVRGAVTQTGQIEYTGDDIRLSEVLDGRLGRYSSRRNILVTSEDGTAEIYDLFRALHEGELDQNPVLAAGDVVTVAQVDREVEVRGEVYRPDLYQLAQDEGAPDLIDYFGGFTPQADLQGLRIQRSSGERPVAFTLTAQELREDMTLEHGDVLIVRSKEARRPVVFLQGGLDERADVPGAEPVGGGVTEDGREFRRTAYPIYQGDTVLDVLQNFRGAFAAEADLKHAYVVRNSNDSVVPVDIEGLLYGPTDDGNVELERFDTIFVPFLPVEEQLFVTVTGAVGDPGRVQYTRAETWQYFVALAGGIDTERNENDKVTVRDSEGRRRPADEPVQAGDSIHVHINDPIYAFDRLVPVITAGLGLFTTIISIIGSLQ